MVRPLAERLRQDGLNRCLSLTHPLSFILHPSLCAFGSDWAQLEAGTFRFRDPLNQERRFIHLPGAASPRAPGASTVSVFAPFVSFRGYQNCGILDERILCRPFRACASFERFTQGVARRLALLGYHLAGFLLFQFEPADIGGYRVDLQHQEPDMSVQDQRRILKILRQALREHP